MYGPKPTASLLVRDLSRQDYRPVWEAMKAFTAGRNATTADEIWFVEHPPVFTQGLSGKPEHLLAPGDIPVMQVDRGGQVTYHGPGQLVAYALIDVRRAELGARRLVTLLEQSVVDLLADYGIEGYARSDAPGVYVAAGKIASLGLRIRRQGSYHGLALNVDLDLEPFQRINPCGYPGLRVTRLRDLGVFFELPKISDDLLGKMIQNFGYTKVTKTTDLPYHLVLGAANARTESV